MRTALALLVATATSVFAGPLVLVAALLRVPDREDSIYDRLQLWWARAIVRAAGVRVVVHGEEHARAGRQIFVANHVSWFDVLVLASIVRRCKFVAKREVRKIPLIGAAANAAGHVYIERHNRKSAFESYGEAAARIHEGARVVVFAEGTRGTSYSLRAFKKGPFVLAVSAQAQIVPTVIHGTIHVQPRGRLRVAAGEVHVHFLEPVATAGLTYEDRDRLAVEVRNRMAALFRAAYGVHSLPWEPRQVSAGNGGRS
jgi:1-acyl-sn-glycerol-3-phosphate acyltransferase